MLYSSFWSMKLAEREANLTVLVRFAMLLIFGLVTKPIGPCRMSPAASTKREPPFFFFYFIKRCAAAAAAVAGPDEDRRPIVCGRCKRREKKRRRRRLISRRLCAWQTAFRGLAINKRGASRRLFPNVQRRLAAYKREGGVQSCRSADKPRHKKSTPLVAPLSTWHCDRLALSNRIASLLRPILGSYLVCSL